MEQIWFHHNILFLHYIYINPYGDINKESNDSVEAILLVKHVEKGVLEIVAKAENLQQIYYKKKDIKEKKKRYEAEVEEENEFRLIVKHHIKWKYRGLVYI